MEKPWLAIPLADYEGHMASPEVAQAPMLAREFGRFLATHRPDSVAVIGCAGGNGFDEAARAGVRRLVGIDINAHYLASARARFGDAFATLELHAADIAGALPPIEPVALVHAALVLEYVDVVAALENIRRLCVPAGVLAVLLQLPKDDAVAVTPSAFASLAPLSAVMTLVPPATLREDADAAGFRFVSQRLVTLASGKSFESLEFVARG